VELDHFDQAYVVAHEVAHHVQTLVGTLQRVRGHDGVDPAGANARSVRLELQAYCFAGTHRGAVLTFGLITPICQDGGERGSEPPS
jgi:predicted metalloprotease